MMKHRWLLTFPILIALLVYIVSACAPTPTPAVQPAATEPPSQETQPPKVHPTSETQEVLTFITSNNDEFELNALKKTIDDFQKLHPNYKIDFTIIPYKSP